MPTLTGLGERAHLVRPEIDLDTHARDVANVFQFEELNRVILVGHSYGGMVITAAAELIADRLAHMVYLDAFVPQDGQSLADLVPPERAQVFNQMREQGGESWRMPPFPLEAFGLFEPEDLKWVGAHLVPHPLGTFTTKVRLTSKVAAAVPKTYIYCNKPAMGFFENMSALARSRKWNHHVVATGHDAMVTAPKEVAQILLGAA